MKARRSPLAAPRRYYPGFFGALFLVLLRIAIGWHFLYEGTQKILSTPEGKASILAKVFPVPEGPPFSSEGYLRASTGPLAPKFRALVPDVDSRSKLDKDALKASMASDLEGVEKHLGFDMEQSKKGEDLLKEAQGKVDDWFLVAENHEKVDKYLAELAEVEAVENNSTAMSYERSNARDDRKIIEADRKALVKQVDALTVPLHDALVGIARPEQAKAAGEYHAPPTSLQQIDLLTMWGLSAVGLCLILGLFTPLAALGGACYLAGFYLSMPPWPGLPEGITEGHYRYVNKNLIEMLACLALASTPSGLWIGVDAVLFGWMGRGRLRRELEAEAAILASVPGTGRPEPQDRRKFKTR